MINDNDENDVSQHDDTEHQLTDLQMGLAGTHEAYLSAMYVGFSRAEALYLAACMLCGGPRPPRPVDA